jgi:hypothetical protein
MVVEVIAGEKFGLLTVLSEVEKKGRDRRVLVRCSCQAQTEKVVFLFNVRHGKTTSCGCVQKSRASQSAKIKSKKHGMHGHRLYGIWQSMKHRCYNKKNNAYAYYGGRGIGVCDRWQKFENFVSDMGDSYQEGLTIERKDYDLGYSPDNCCWATITEQSRNKRNNVNATLNGQTKCVAVWCVELGLEPGAVRSRIRRGRTPEEALTFKRTK